ncbi:hypothetical protein L6164_032619 [Bauhinia variegata]|uniref:Uncharacterized protein n=1 Tax=Bauhinia variegata TaxID=167791 RepID=A0ACB9KPE1_BAUVA|nr:hypothetical protein L6164_032619 [Bauhinia variegata]
MAAAVPIEITVKSLSESGLKSIPSCFASKNLQDLEVIDPQEGTIPIIDFSLLTSSDPQHKSKIIQDLGRACEEWGFFLLINHGVSESLMKNIMDGLKGFSDLSDEEKREFQGNHVMDHITRSVFNADSKKVHCWRDFLKCFAHPEFHFLNKPTGLG